MSETAGPIQLGPGIVTVSEWLGANDGSTYLRFWSPSWFVSGETDVFGKVVRGNSGFFVVAGEIESPAMIIPGCRFSCHFRAREAPTSRDVYVFGCHGGADG